MATDLRKHISLDISVEAINAKQFGSFFLFIVDTLTHTFEIHLLPSPISVDVNSLKKIKRVTRNNIHSISCFHRSFSGFFPFCVMLSSVYFSSVHTPHLKCCIYTYIHFYCVLINTELSVHFFYRLVFCFTTVLLSGFPMDGH